MIDPLPEVLARLRSRGTEPRRSRSGWSARCPAHDDRSPSLSIASGNDGRVLVHCHAGCRFTEIAAALGMASKDLSPVKSPVLLLRRRSHLVPRTAPPPARQPAPRTFDSWKAAFQTSLGAPTATWFYRDATGRVVGVVARFRDGAAGKTFRQASLGEQGRWTATGMPKPRPLYRLPELLASQDTVYVAEGEKCADALAAIGMVAVTSIGGASNAHHSDWTPLAGRRVVIIPDSDEQGDKYASDVSRLANGASASATQILSMAVVWPDVPPKGDVADWMEAHASQSPAVLRSILVQHAVNAPAVALPSLPAVISSRRMRRGRPRQASRRHSE